MFSNTFLGQGNIHYHYITYFAAAFKMKYFFWKKCHTWNERLPSYGEGLDKLFTWALIFLFNEGIGPEALWYCSESHQVMFRDFFLKNYYFLHCKVWSTFQCHLYITARIKRLEFFFFFGLVVGRILVSQPGIRFMCPGLGMWKLNHWTTREILLHSFLTEALFWMKERGGSQLEHDV